MLVGKNVRILMPNPDSSNHDKYMRSYLDTREAKIIGRSRDVVGMTQDGSLMPLNLTITEQGTSLISTATLVYFHSYLPQ